MTYSSGRNEKFASEKGIHTDFLNKMTYGDYLQLDALLSSQKRLSDHHDEMLFIIIHQSQIIHAWDVLSTLTPAEYMEFRDKLGQASGFQSYQYRMIEFALGYKTDYILKIYEKDPVLYEELKEALYAPSIYDVALKALARAGFAINPDLLNRDYSVPYKEDPTVEAAWLEVYKNVDQYWELYQLAEKLIDIEDWLQQWRFRHMKTVERIIGHKMGTGGSSGVTYLKQVLDHRFFPELWNIRTKL
jgi:tryptophan 2,3-dioxygenase